MLRGQGRKSARRITTGRVSPSGFRTARRLSYSIQFDRLQCRGAVFSRKGILLVTINVRILPYVLKIRRFEHSNDFETIDSFCMVIASAIDRWLRWSFRILILMLCDDNNSDFGTFSNEYFQNRTATKILLFQIPCKRKKKKPRKLTLKTN